MDKIKKSEKKEEEFAGKTTITTNYLHKYEMKVFNWLTPRIPKWLTTKRLTLMSLLWSGLVILFYWLASKDANWIWLTSLILFLHWITDGIDGNVGRYRNEGFVKWGFYMDHLLDYVFMCCVIVGMGLLAPGISYTIMIMALIGLFFVHSFLGFAATNKFRNTFLRVGATELRILVIGLNALFYFVKLKYISWGGPTIIGGFSIFLIYIIIKQQKELHNLDMEAKNKK